MRILGNSNSGGVAMRVAVCAASFILLALAIVFFMGNFKSGKEEDFRKAERLAVEGLEKALMELDPSNGAVDFSDRLSDESEDGSFDVAVTRDEQGDIVDIKIVSTGTSGSVARTEERTVRLRLTVTEEGDSAWVNEGIR